MDGFQVAVHAIGDAANAQVLDAIEELAETYKGDRRWRIEHAQIVDPADLPRFGQARHRSPRCSRSHADVRPADGGGAARAGAAGRRLCLARRCCDSEVPLAFGSDFPVEAPDPFAGLAGGDQPRGCRRASRRAAGCPQQTADASTEALAAFTTGAAYAGFAEDRIGSAARPAIIADFILIDRDPFDATPAAIRATQVIETWIGGKRNALRKRYAAPG